MTEIKHVTLKTSTYLLSLHEIAHPPRIINVLGKLPDQRVKTVAIVGTRRPTSYGKEVTFKLAYELAKRGVIIVSGLAFGIDKIAHQAALEAGGTTIAVLANGLDSIYPASHRGLAKEIIQKGGAILSEYPEGTSAHKHHFLARNRIVSGLADAVIVTEAGRRSGTLSTVNHALDQNKEIFAVPGNITSVQSIGPNMLISQGAHPALSYESILDIIAPELLRPQTTLPLLDDPLQSTLIGLLHSGISNNEQLLQGSKALAPEFMAALTMLEIRGFIQADQNGGWRITP